MLNADALKEDSNAQFEFIEQFEMSEFAMWILEDEARIDEFINEHEKEWNVFVNNKFQKLLEDS